MKQNFTITTKSCLGLQFIQAAGWVVVKLGSNANNSANTGAFYMNANNTSSNVNVNIGSQLTLLLKQGIKTVSILETLPLGKIKKIDKY